VFAGSTPIGNGLTGGVGGLWGTPAALVMNGALAFSSSAVAAVAVLQGRVPWAGGGRNAAPTEPTPAAASMASTLRQID
jgi:hypothetical protein